MSDAIAMITACLEYQQGQQGLSESERWCPGLQDRGGETVTASIIVLPKADVNIDGSRPIGWEPSVS